MNSTEKDLKETCKALIVDDSEVDCQTYQRYLEKSDAFNFVTFVSNSGQDGLAMCLQHKPDIVLLDYRLPDMDGLEFLQLLQRKHRTLPLVIVLTGQGKAQVAVALLKAGAQDYLVKSYLDPNQLVQAIRRALVQRNLEQIIEQQKRQQQVMVDVALRINQSLDLEVILETAVVGIRQLLGCDRTLVYCFESDRSGTVVAESVLPRWLVTLGSEIEDSCFQKGGINRYMSGHKTVINDIHQSSLSPCHVKLLEQFQVKANIVVPILVGGSVTHKQTRLWGLLMAHHCRSTRIWQAYELGMLSDLSVQLSTAIQQSELVSALEQRAQALAEVNQQLTTKTQQMEANCEN